MRLLPPIVFTGSDGGSIVTPLATFVDGDGRSTETPLMAFIDSVDAHHSHALGVCVPTTLSPPSTSTTGICRATPPPLAAPHGFHR